MTLKRKRWEDKVNNLGTIVDQWLRWRLLVFVILITIILFQSINNLMGEINGAYQQVARSGWQVANVWMDSAECMRKTGAWLVVCDGNRLIPISEKALADDPGHALLLSLAATLLDRKMRVMDIVYLNMWINMTALAILLSIFFAMRADVIWVLLLILSNKIFFAWTGDSPHPSHIGVAALASVLPLTLLAYEKGVLGRKRAMIFGVVGLVSLALATLIRGAIGHMGFIITVAALVWIGWKRRQHIRVWGVVLFVGILVIAAWQSPRLVLMVRDGLFDVQPPVHIQGHGISHNLYIGLGVVPNKFGIKWDDGDGARAVQQARPGTEYVSPDYFRVLWGLYLEHLREAPMEVTRIYMVKAKQLLQEQFWKGWLPLWVTLIIGLALFVLLRRRESEHRIEIAPLMPILSISFGFILLFLVQGILAHPSRQYAAPIDVFVVLIIGVVMEYGWRRMMVKRDSRFFDFG